MTRIDRLRCCLSSATGIILGVQHFVMHASLHRSRLRRSDWKESFNARKKLRSQDLPILRADSAESTKQQISCKTCGKSTRGSEEFQSDGGQHRWHLGTCRWTPEVRAVYKDLQECCSFGLEGLFLFIKFLTARDAAAGVQREAREKRCCGCCGCCFWMFRFFVLTIPGGGRGRSTCHRTGTAAWEPFAKAAGVYLSTLDLRYSTWTRSTKTIKTIKTYKFIQIIHVIT